jgi:hypothetical protein
MLLLIIGEFYLQPMNADPAALLGCALPICVNLRSSTAYLLYAAPGSVYERDLFEPASERPSPA